MFKFLRLINIYIYKIMECRISSNNINRAAFRVVLLQVFNIHNLTLQDIENSKKEKDLKLNTINIEKVHKIVPLFKKMLQYAIMF